MALDDFPRALAIKVDRLLELIDAGLITPDAIDLLGVAHTLREHGETKRADRCLAIARRQLPALVRHPW